MQNDSAKKPKLSVRLDQVVQEGIAKFTNINAAEKAVLGGVRGAIFTWADKKPDEVIATLIWIKEKLESVLNDETEKLY